MYYINDVVTDLKSGSTGEPAHGNMLLIGYVDMSGLESRYQKIGGARTVSRVVEYVHQGKWKLLKTPFKNYYSFQRIH